MHRDFISDRYIDRAVCLRLSPFVNLPATRRWSHGSTAARRPRRTGSRPPLPSLPMSFRPEAIRGSSGTGGVVDYRLTRQAVVRQYRKGRLSQARRVRRPPRAAAGRRRRPAPPRRSRAPSARRRRSSSSPTRSGRACPRAGAASPRPARWPSSPAAARRWRATWSRCAPAAPGTTSPVCSTSAATEPPGRSV